MKKIFVILSLCLWGACSEDSYETIDNSFIYSGNNEITKSLLEKLSSATKQQLLDYDNNQTLLFDKVVWGINKFGKYYAIPIDSNGEIKSCLLCKLNKQEQLENIMEIDYVFIKALSISDKFIYSSIFSSWYKENAKINQEIKDIIKYFAEDNIRIIKNNTNSTLTRSTSAIYSIYKVEINYCYQCSRSDSHQCVLKRKFDYTPERRRAAGVAKAYQEKNPNIGYAELDEFEIDDNAAYHVAYPESMNIDAIRTSALGLQNIFIDAFLWPCTYTGESINVDTSIICIGSERL